MSHDALRALLSQDDFLPRLREVMAAYVVETIPDTHEIYRFMVWAHAAPPGSLCEHCLDAPAVVLVPAPWGGERGMCAGCQASLDR